MHTMQEPVPALTTFSWSPAGYSRSSPLSLVSRDGIRAWDTYQETGLHVTHAEADAWLAKLAASDDREPPECHN